MITITAISAFTDNYLWLLSAGANAVIVDPGDAAPVMQVLAQRGLKLCAILITHHHPDHIGGVEALLDAYSVPVYGPAAEQSKIGCITQALGDGDRVRIDALDLNLEVLSVPGHTLGHIAYYAPLDAVNPGRLFCGDTLFAAGCGRLFEGTAAQMYGSLQTLMRLPGATEVYCAHEYTAANLAFAKAVEPENAKIDQEIERVRGVRGLKNLPSLPTTLGGEASYNPFLRCTKDTVRRSVELHAQCRIDDPVEIFARLRSWKDGFRTDA